MAEFDRYQQDLQNKLAEEQRRKALDEARKKNEQEKLDRSLTNADLQARTTLESYCNELSHTLDSFMEPLQIERLLKDGMVTRHNINELLPRGYSYPPHTPRLIEPPKSRLLRKISNWDGFSETYKEIRKSTVFTLSDVSLVDSSVLLHKPSSKQEFVTILDRGLPVGITNTISLGYQTYKSDYVQIGENSYREDLYPSTWEAIVVCRSSYLKTDGMVLMNISSDQTITAGFVEHHWSRRVSARADSRQLKDVIKQQLAICFGFEK